MSIKSVISKLILSGLLVLTILLFNNQRLTSTSILISKSSHLDDFDRLQKLSGHKNNIPRKVGAPIFVEVTSSSNSTSLNHDEFIGKINLQRFDIDQVYFSWTLPDGSALESGELSGSISAIGNSGSISIPIAVNNLNQSINQNIILNAWIISNGEKLGTSGNAATLPEETYEHKVNLPQSRGLASSAATGKLNKMSDTQSFSNTDSNPIRKIQF